MFFINKIKKIKTKVVKETKISIWNNKEKIVFSIMLLICIILNYNITKCINLKTPFFIENKIENYSYFFQNSISKYESELVFEQYLYKLQKNTLNIDIAKYYYMINESINVNINSNFSHPNIFVGNFKNIYANHPLSHFKYKEFYINLGKPDFLGLKRDQFISSKVFFYNKDDLQQIILTNLKKKEINNIENEFVIKDIIKQKIYSNNYKKVLDLKKEDIIKAINKEYKK